MSDLQQKCWEGAKRCLLLIHGERFLIYHQSLAKPEIDRVLPTAVLPVQQFSPAVPNLLLEEHRPFFLTVDPHVEPAHVSCSPYENLQAVTNRAGSLGRWEGRDNRKTDSSHHLPHVPVPQFLLFVICLDIFDQLESPWELLLSKISWLKQGLT